MITGDGNLVELQATIRYVIAEPRVYLLNVREPDTILRAATESVLREAVAGQAFQDLLTVQRERFQQEGRVAANLDHPHIVQVFEAGEVAGICYIASAYCPGTDLAAWLGQHALDVPADEAASFVAMLRPPGEPETRQRARQAFAEGGARHGALILAECEDGFDIDGAQRAEDERQARGA